MAFEVIPAIDVAGGRLAMYTSQGPIAVQAFDGDPLEAARAYAAAGAGRVHVVDMDLAFGGRARNLDVVRDVSALGISVQAAGGVRDVAEVASMLEAGAGRVVWGSAALADARGTEAAIERFGERLLLGVEVDGGDIRPRGGDAGGLPLVETLGWLVAAGAHAFLVTAVTRVASLEGPDLATIRRVVRAGRPVIAAGGIAGVDDLDALRRLGAAGAVVGRAASEGLVPLADLLARH
jgi:phosphoribosylformimino-5-aminoimidazole carboxamide ribotide isomerase/phosphoribosylanthranilate isomerase